MTPPRFRLTLACFSCALLVLAAGCGRKSDQAKAPSGHGHSHSHGHTHTPPHGGTPVVLGEERYHLEFVLDGAAGTLRAYVLDGHMEDFVRTAQPSFEVTATVAGAERTLTFQAVANPATGERVGDTALFEAGAEWLKTAREFDAVLKTLTIRGQTFADVAFPFPKGNEPTHAHDHAH